MLKQRLLTALILIPLVLIAVLKLDVSWFALLFAIIISIGSYELGRLCSLNKKGSYIYSFFAFIAMILLYYLDNAVINFWILFCAVICCTLSLFIIIAYQLKNIVLAIPTFYINIIIMILGKLILISTWLALLFLKSVSETFPYLLIYLLFLVWAADSGAYFIGKKFGKTALASRISPGKTWEGISGGVFFGLTVTAIYIIMVKVDNKLVFTSLSVIVIFFSIIGDLTESIIKRIANVKDSGHILPGHGGVIDRIDGLTYAALIFVFSLLFMGII